MERPTQQHLVRVMANGTRVRVRVGARARARVRTPHLRGSHGNRRAALAALAALAARAALALLAPRGSRPPLGARGGGEHGRRVEQPPTERRPLGLRGRVRDRVMIRVRVRVRGRVRG